MQDALLALTVQALHNYNLPKVIQNIFIQEQGENVLENLWEYVERKRLCLNCLLFTAVFPGAYKSFLYTVNVHYIFIE